jgi:hypothetical protein
MWIFFVFLIPPLLTSPLSLSFGHLTALLFIFVVLLFLSPLRRGSPASRRSFCTLVCFSPARVAGMCA